MDATDMERSTFAEDATPDSPSAWTRDDHVNACASDVHMVQRHFRQPYVKPAFHHQIAFKQLLSRRHGNAAADNASCPGSSDG